jgi:hypothetical protein
MFTKKIQVETTKDKCIKIILIKSASYIHGLILFILSFKHAHSSSCSLVISTSTYPKPLLEHWLIAKL